MDLYGELILDHAKRPQHAGLREPYDVEVNHVNPTCGDEITVRVAFDGSTIIDLSYDGQGCSISQASASVLHELVSGQEMEEAFATEKAFTELMHGRGEVEPDEDVLGDGVAA